MANQLFTGTINYTKMLEALKKGKYNTYKTEEGTVYVNISVWLNEESDQYGNDGSLQLQNKKEFKDEKKIYLGNLKRYTPKVQEPDEDDFEDMEDDLPF